ncbi:Dual-specificity RNA methyltransferase RlmN (fragment) [Methylocella tundrae]|uniref:Dual-specificity RNA methyltransferase RlmN n=1 Tax=Methylocella tundrae TaxID=227605 RepID=A0A4U8Z1R3_METTU
MTTSTLIDSTAAEAVAPAPSRSLAGATRKELAAALLEIGAPEREIRMRSAQLWHWIYHQGVSSFDDMLNISKVFSRKARRAFYFDAAADRL